MTDELVRKGGETWKGLRLVATAEQIGTAAPVVCTAATR